MVLPSGVHLTNSVGRAGRVAKPNVTLVDQAYSCSLVTCALSVGCTQYFWMRLAAKADAVEPHGSAVLQGPTYYG